MATAEELQELALRLSAFTNTLTQRTEQLMRDNQQASHSVLQATQGFAEQSRLLSQQLVQAVSGEARGAIERGAGEGLRSASDALHAAAKDARMAGASLDTALDKLRTAQQALVWKAGLAVLVGCLLAVGGSSYLVWRNHQELARAEFPRNLLEATHSGALAPCGAGLCARIGAKPRRFGAKGEFAEVR